MKNTNSHAKPLAGGNALEAAVFAIELHQPPSPTGAVAIRAALDQFANELPGEQAGHPPGLFFGMGGPMPPIGELVRFKAKPNGEHAWRVQLTGPVLQVICTAYTRFADVWAQAQRYLLAMLAATDEPLLVTGISHQYIDKFLYPPHMQPGQYNMGELFLPDTPYLTAKAWKSGLQWHVYQGWFESEDASHRVLQQLNVSNVEILGSQPQVACIIDHRSTHQVSSAAPLITEVLGSAGNDTLDEIMKTLHSTHKTMLKQLLQPTKLEEIGMVN